jgi:hypothetical protein
MHCVAIVEALAQRALDPPSLRTRSTTLGALAQLDLFERKGSSPDFTALGCRSGAEAHAETRAAMRTERFLQRFVRFCVVVPAPSSVRSICLPRAFR